MTSYRDFLPEEDQGYIIVFAQAPPGASLEYTTKALDRASAIVQHHPDVEGVFSVPGFTGGSSSASNQGLMFAKLKAINDRRGEQHSAATIVNALRGQLMGVSEAMIIPLPPPPIQGLGSYGGFAFELQQTGAGSPEDLEQMLGGLSSPGAAALLGGCNRWVPGD